MGRRLHWRAGRHKTHTLLALTPAAAAGIYAHGPRAAALLALAMTAAQATDWLFELVKRRFRPPAPGLPPPAFHLRGGALITGALVGLVLPPSAPAWSAVLAPAAGLAVAKHGMPRLFNPVVVGVLAVVALAPSAFAGYTLGFGADAVASASRPGGAALRWWGRIGGSIGEASGAALLAGGAWLVLRRVIDVRVPALLLAVVAGLALAYGDDPLRAVCSGGLVMAALFIVTDPATSPRSRAARLLQVLWLAAAVVLFRRFSAIPSEGVAYGVLAANAATPLLDRLLPPGLLPRGT